MTERILHVHIELTGEPELGIWCDACALPARIRFNLVVITDHGVDPLEPVERCVKCDGYDDESVGDPT